MADRAPRRTQEERTAHTRGRLLDATVSCLLDEGYAATTTRRVAELAGVSQGAQTHHFPYRVDLVAAAIQRLAEQRITAIETTFAALPTDPVQRVPLLLDALWRDFSGDDFTVFVKVWVAAADDDALHARLVPIERFMARAVARGSTVDALVVGSADDLLDRMTLVLATLRGLALTTRFEPRARPGRDPWPVVRPHLTELLLAAFREPAGA